MPIHLVRGDITQFAADAIVNAANANLLTGGGVCGAIHAAAGPTLAEACRSYVEVNGPLMRGEAIATGAGDLSTTRYVIHTVGPVWRGGTSSEPEALANAYRAAVEVADSLGLASIGFPSISTGTYGYPAYMAAPVAFQAVEAALRHAISVRDVTFVLYDEDTYDAYALAWAGSHPESAPA
jgi:O-acetyl-ADP-ribose deacetylase